MANRNLRLLENAARLLQTLLEELVFAGRCAAGLLVTDPMSTKSVADSQMRKELAAVSNHLAIKRRPLSLLLSTMQSPRMKTQVKSV
jgi:hypothetical protein